jgi:thymidylate kinase
MPQPDIVFFLDAPPDVLLARKQEVPIETLVRSREAYLSLAETNDKVRVIDASLPFEQVIQDVLTPLPSKPEV